ncbi:MAG: peptidylprolyl isomerase, partial [Brachymonas sp.]|nr:peptidylprolyl isomerase [Brachymonas sp.]
NQHANDMAREMAANGGQTPAREALLRQSLDDLILKKAAIQSVRDTTMKVTDEEIANAERTLASRQNMSPQEFRRRVMAERRIRESEYRKELTEQLMLQKMRDARTGMAAEKVTELDALHWLRTQNTSELRVVENRARHILLPATSEAEAQQAAAKLADVRRRVAANKLDFAGAARELSKDASAAQGGDLGWAPEGVFVPEFQEQVSALQPGQLSQPFLSRFGVHLVQLLDRRASPMTQDQQLQAARNAVRQQKSQEALQKWESEVRAQAYVEMREAPR